MDTTGVFLYHIKDDGSLDVFEGDVISYGTTYQKKVYMFHAKTYKNNLEVKDVDEKFTVSTWEGAVLNGYVWLRRRNDGFARELLINYLQDKIDKAKSSISMYEFMKDSISLREKTSYNSGDLKFSDTFKKKILSNISEIYNLEEGYGLFGGTLKVNIDFDKDEITLNYYNDENVLVFNWWFPMVIKQDSSLEIIIPDTYTKVNMF